MGSRESLIISEPPIDKPRLHNCTTQHNTAGDVDELRGMFPQYRRDTTRDMPGWVGDTAPCNYIVTGIHQFQMHLIIIRVPIRWPLLEAELLSDA
jgi:hypothetical protein